MYHQAQALRCLQRNGVQIKNSGIPNYGNKIRERQQDQNWGNNVAHSHMLGTLSSTFACITELISIPILKRKKLKTERGLLI